MNWDTPYTYLMVRRIGGDRIETIRINLSILSPVLSFAHAAAFLLCRS